MVFQISLCRVADPLTPTPVVIRHVLPGGVSPGRGPMSIPLPTPVFRVHLRGLVDTICWRRDTTQAPFTHSTRCISRGLFLENARLIGGRSSGSYLGVPPAHPLQC